MLKAYNSYSPQCSPQRDLDSETLETHFCSTAIFYRLGVNMRHAGAVWMLLNDKCKELAKELKKAETELKKKELENELEEHKSARRGVVQEMFTRTAKNLLRRDLRGAMEMGAGVYEIGQVRCLICSRAFTYSCRAADVYLIVAFCYS